MAMNNFNNGKRQRAQDHDDVFSDFYGHRTKRQAVVLAHRQSPTQKTSSSINLATGSPGYPAFIRASSPDSLTPVNSDSEDNLGVAEGRSIFSPYSPTPRSTPAPNGPTSPCPEALGRSVRAVVFECPAHPDDDDLDMIDSGQKPQVGAQAILAGSLSARVPTPIRSSFASSTRYDERDHVGANEGFAERFRHGRRLPSPISEDEISPGYIGEGVNEMQMEVENLVQSETENSPSSKKCYERPKHCLRSWSGHLNIVGRSSTDLKRSFSMGYRGDCEKCRMKVPGHFSHIISIE